MQIILNEKDIKTAILQFLGNNQLTLTNTPVVELSMKGRGGADGMVATINLDGSSEKAEPVANKEPDVVLKSEEPEEKEADALFGSEEEEKKPEDPDTKDDFPFSSFS